MKALKWILASLAALLAVLLIVVSIVLSPKVLTRIAVKAASGFVDGTVEVSRVNATVLRSWPVLQVEIDSLRITYPHETFSQYDSLAFPTSESSLMMAGRGELADTLAVIDHISAGLDWHAFLWRKVISIPSAEIKGLDAIGHMYDSTSANWDIIRIPESTDTTKKAAPAVEAGGISISGIRRVVLTSPCDTLFASALFDAFDLQGEAGIDPDSGIQAGIKGTIDGRAHFLNGILGAVDAPVFIETETAADIAPEGEISIGIGNLSARVASLPLEAAGDIRLAGDSTFVKGHAIVENCPLGQILEDYRKFFPAVLDGLRTDARMTLTAEADGWFGSVSGLLPLMKASVSVPDSHISYEGLMEDGDFDLTLMAATDEAGLVNADLEDLCFDLKGLKLNMSGSGSDLLGKDPQFGVKAFACTEFADLVKYLPPETGINAEGDVDFEVEGSFLLSQLNLQEINKADLRGHVFSEGVRFSAPADTLYAYASHPDIHISTEGQKLAVDAGMDSIRFIAGASTFIMGTGIALDAKNSGQVMSTAGKIQPLDADLSLKSFNMRGTDSLTLGIRDSRNKIGLGKVTSDGSVHSDVSLQSRNRLAFMRTGANRISLQDAVFNASLRKRAARPSSRSMRMTSQQMPRPERRFYMDSSFRRRMMGDSLGMPQRTLPDYLKEIDFRKKDINIDIGEGISSLYRKWAPSAEISISRGNVNTPLLPLSNSISMFDCSFNGDQIDIENLLLTSGTTTIGFRGRLGGLQPVLMGMKTAPLNAVVTVHSRMLNLNEILAAVEAGSKLNADADSEEEFVIEGLENAEQELDFSAIVVPANLNANLTVDIDSVRYSKLALRDFTSRLRMRERCLQLTNTSAGSEFGDVAVDAFYSTVSKDDIKAGFNLQLSSITADRIITLIPAVDSLVPMLKSFKGNLNCDLAATTQLDTNMNIIIPSVSGAVKLNGSGLELSDTGDLRRIAQLLMFKDTKVGHIDDMSVNCIIADNQLEVFPFLLGVDRYTLGLSGLQGFDQNFKYHISVIKSPLPFKFGVNLKGTFDNWHYSIGKAKYKSTSIPLFAPQVDTMQVNLTESIKNIFQKGVDAAVREYALERQRVNLRRNEYGLFEGREDEDEELSDEEKKQIDSYMLDMECDATTEALEKEIDELLDEELENLISGLVENL